MASLKALRPHISADGVYRAVDEVYEESNSEYAAIRVDMGAVERVDESVGKPAKAKKEPVAGVVAGEALIED